MLNEIGTKVCSKCKKVKTLANFSKHKRNKDGLRYICKDCEKTYIKNYHQSHAKNIKQYKKRHYQENLEHINELKEENHNKYPWKRSFYSARSRCNNKNDAKYSTYGARGIKFRMTLDDFETLWYRDKAYEMKKPSIDRKDNDGNYEYANCRFIEFEDNTLRATRKTILQYDLEGNFIKEWDSIKEAGIYYDTVPESIGRCCRGLSKISCGFKWRFK